MNTYDKRTKIFSGILMSLFVCFGIFIVAINIVVPRPDTRKSDVYEGAIYTYDGTLLTDFQNLDSSDSEIKHARSLLYPEEYSPVLGYNSQYYGSNGLRQRFERWIYNGKKDQSGSPLTLTINHELQMFCYDLFKEYDDASVVIMENETGALRTLVSVKDIVYDANKIEELDFENLSDGFFYPSYEMSYTPGSTFKVLSTVVLVEADLEAYTYTDTTGYIKCGEGEGVINNAGSDVKGELTLNEALKESANVYFVSALEENKEFYEKLKDVANRFKLGETLELDFCSLDSSFDYNPTTEFEKGLAVFGQGPSTQISPIHNALVFSTIVNEGKMYKPYLIETNTDRNIIDVILKKNTETKPQVIDKHVIEKKTAIRVKEAMAYTAESYGLENCWAKSGTAELNEDGLYQLWLICSTENHTICLSATSYYGYGSSLIKPMQQILDFIEENDI